MKKAFINIILGALSVFLVIFSSSPVRAAISPADQATFDQILQPVLRIYDFVKYAATVILYLLDVTGFLEFFNTVLKLGFTTKNLFFMLIPPTFTPLRMQKSLRYHPFYSTINHHLRR